MKSKEERNARLLLMFLISNVVGMILAWFASRIPLKPLGRAINRINQLASGDFKVRLHYDAPFNTHPDFRELESSFNKLAEELDSTEWRTEKPVLCFFVKD